MKKQIRVAFCAILVFIILALLFVACDKGKSEGAAEKARGIAHKSEYYVALNESEKTDFDAKLNDIIESEYFKNLDENGQTELVGKFVESEKTIKEIANDPKDKNPEDLDEITATQQEIKYWEIVKTVKEATENNLTFRIENPDLTIRRVNGIYKNEGTGYINSDFVRREVIDGKTYYSQYNMFCRINEIVTGEETTDEIIAIFSNKSTTIHMEKICINRNSEEQLERFDEIRKSNNLIMILDKHNYVISVIESWETTDHSYPEYIFKANSDDDERWYMLTYAPSIKCYGCQPAQRICPEFWAQLEIERAKNNN